MVNTQSTLIRFTSSDHVDSYLSGDLYLSSLSSFWDFMKGKIPIDDVESGKVTAEDIKKAEEYYNSKQQDISEGAALQVKRDVLKDIVDAEVYPHIIHDVRFRVYAYCYVNLLCFYRVDAIDGAGYGPITTFPIDDENVYSLAKDKGIRVPGRFEDFQKISSEEAYNIAKRISEKNNALSSNQYHIVQLPPRSMDTFGDAVIVIKDQDEFVRRVIAAVERQGGDVITGNVRYHDMMDRIDPGTMMKNSVSIIMEKTVDDTSATAGSIPGLDKSTAVVNIHEILKGRDDVIHLGSLDKYYPYIKQKEWRICWLSEVHDTKPKYLHCGRLDDIIEVVPTKDIRKYLLRKYPGYIPGITERLNEPYESKGTVSYKAFKDTVENIDGLSTVLFELC